MTRMASDAEGRARHARPVLAGRNLDEVKAVADPLGLSAQPSIVYFVVARSGPPEAERAVTSPILPYDNRSMARRSVNLASPCCKPGKPLPLTH